MPAPEEVAERCGEHDISGGERSVVDRIPSKLRSSLFGADHNLLGAPVPVVVGGDLEIRECRRKLGAFDAPGQTEVGAKTLSGPCPEYSYDLESINPGAC